MNFAGCGRCSCLYFFPPVIAFFFFFLGNYSHGSLTSFLSKWNLSVPLFHNFCREMSVLQNWLLFGSYFQLYSIIKGHLLLKASFGGRSTFISCRVFLLALQFFMSVPQIIIKSFTCEIVANFLINRDFPFSLVQRGKWGLSTLCLISDFQWSTVPQRSD